MNSSDDETRTELPIVPYTDMKTAEDIFQEVDNLIAELHSIVSGCFGVEQLDEINLESLLERTRNEIVFCGVQIIKQRYRTNVSKGAIIFTISSYIGEVKRSMETLANYLTEKIAVVSEIENKVYSLGDGEICG